MLNKLINKIKPRKKQEDKQPETKPGQKGKKQLSQKIRDFGEGLVSVQDIIAPSAIEVDFDWIRINNQYYRTLFVVNYPRFVSANWLSSLINFDHSLDISMNIYPTEGKEILSNLRRKIAEMEAEISSDVQRGKVVDPSTKAKLEDALSLQEELVKGVEKFFQFGLYITIGAESVKKLNQITKELESNLGSLLIIPKHATLQMEKGFKTTLPLADDKLNVTRNMDTTSLATTFPFVSSDLSDDKGIMYGLNEHNGSLVVFDRFSMENANSILFAKSGAGKSIDGDEPVLVHHNNKTQLTKIGPLIDNLIEEYGVEKIEPEIEGVSQPPSLKVYTFNQSLQGKWSKVAVAARKKAPKKMYQVTTQSGREIMITGDHNLVTLKNGKVAVKQGRKAKIGDYLPLPRQTKNKTKKPATVNLLETLKGSRKIYVYGASKLMEKFKSEFYKNDHPNCRYLYKYAQSRPVPITFFHWCLKNTQKELPKGWRKKLKFGSRLGKSTQLPIKLKIDEGLAYLLGLITAEGTVQDYMVAISSNNLKLQEKAIKSIKKLGFNYFKPNKNEIRITSYLFAQLITKVGVGQGAGNKQIPGVVFDSPPEVSAKFIQGYFDGDGGVENNQICATSKSKQLINQLSYLLNFFNIHTRLKPKIKYASNTKQKKPRKYWQIAISGGKNIRNFKKKINFSIDYKKKKLFEIDQKENTTNVDSIPLEKEIFVKLSKYLYPTTNVKTPQILLNLKQGRFSCSPKGLNKVIKICQKRLKKLKKWQRITKPKLEKLSPLKNITNKIANKKDLNRQAWQKLGQSWRVVKNEGVKPGIKNALILNNIVREQHLTPNGLISDLQESFQVLGVYQKDFDTNFFETLRHNQQANIGYEKILAAQKFILKTWQKRQKEIVKAEAILKKLKDLVESNLFWDPITKIEEKKYQKEWVYDLTVDNQVFLSGFGGLYVHNSYLVKLEALRSLMFGTEVMVLDPENEYKALTEAVGGQYITFSFDAKSKINPFDLEITADEESQNQLGRKIMALHSLFKLIMGKMDAKEEALLDRALIQTYKMRGITTNNPPKEDTEMPLIEDLYKVLLGMEEEQAASLAARLEKFIKGSFSGLFNSQTNVELDNEFIVFGIRDLEEKLRPIAMHIILDFIWNKIRRNLKKRILIVDEAWYLMQYADTAQYLYSLAKRARKYYLGLTTITQDVQDFLGSDYGRAIVTNSSIQVLLKQHPAAIDQVAEVFYLSEGEKQLLLGADVGEGIFFAGQNHVAIRVIASPSEHKLITSSPEDIIAMKEGKEIKTAPKKAQLDEESTADSSPTQRGGQTETDPTGREQY